MKGASGHDDIAASNELQRLSDQLLEARSNFDKRKTAKKENKVHAADVKESAASFLQDAGLRMLGLVSNAKLPAQHAQLAGDDQGKDQEMSTSPASTSGGRGKDKAPRRTPKRQQEESEEREQNQASFQETMMVDLQTSKKFLQDYLTLTAEQDRRAATAKQEAAEKLREIDAAEKIRERKEDERNQELHKMMAMSTIAMSKMFALLEKKGLFE